MMTMTCRVAEAGISHDEWEEMQYRVVIELGIGPSVDHIHEIGAFMLLSERLALAIERKAREERDDERRSFGRY
jgi:hypothetical protein